MINDDFRYLISEKIQSLEKEKRKSQITQESEKLKQIEDQQQTLYTMVNYPLSFASSKCSMEEIDYILYFYRTSIEMSLGKINQEIDSLIGKWTDANFLNEVAAYTIFNIISSNDLDELKIYLDLLKRSHSKGDNLYSAESIDKIIEEKFHGFPLVVNLIECSNPLEVVSEKVPDFKDFKSKFEDEVIEYYNQYVAKNEKISLPFSEDIRSMLSKRIAPLLSKRDELKEKLEHYENIDYNDEKSVNKYVDEIIENTYQTKTTSLPFYASYDLDELDKLIKITSKIDKASDKKLLFETIEAYKKQLEVKLKHDKRKEYKEKYESKYGRFEDINQMLHMGDYSEGDTIDYFSVFVRHTLNSMGIPFCDSCEYIDTITKRQFGSNDKLIEEVKQKIEKSVEKSGIKSEIAQYIKLKKSLIPKIHKERIKGLEEEIQGKIPSIVMSIRNSYAKEGYQLFEELPFLDLSEGKLFKPKEDISLEDTIEKDNNMLFNANYITVTNTKGKDLDSRGYTLDDIMGVRKDNNEDFEDNMQTLHENINKMIKGNITEGEISSLCELTEPELKQVTEENALLKMQTVREIMVKYDELEDKTIATDDNKVVQIKSGK